MSVLLGEERQKLLTSLEIGNVNEKGSPRGESWCSAFLAQSRYTTEAAAQALGSKTSWNGLPSISQTRQATLGAMPEGSKCFLMYNTKHVKEELQSLLALQQTATIWAMFLTWWAGCYCIGWTPIQESTEGAVSVCGGAGQILHTPSGHVSISGDHVGRHFTLQMLREAE